MNFEFKLNTQTYFGNGVADTLVEKLKSFGFSKPGIVIDESVFSVPPAQKLIELFNKSTIPAQHILKTRTNQEPDYEYLDLCAEECKKYHLDCIIGIGGGSTLDLCKGIAVLLKNPGKGIDYRGMDKVGNPSLPSILIPTTAGTGSEATFTAVFIDRKNKVKMGINGKNVSAFAAFIDSDFTASCPHHVAVGAGLDAMVHALEAFMTTKENPIIWKISIQSWTILFKSFMQAINDPENHNARLGMMLGSYLAGITLMYSGGGIAGALSYPLGAEYNIPHGLAGGVLLKHIIEANIKGGYDGYSILYDEMEHDNSLVDSSEKSKKFLDKFNSLLLNINAPVDLKTFAVPKSKISEVAKSSVEKRNAVLKRNPILVDEAMLERLLVKVL